MNLETLLRDFSHEEISERELFAWLTEHLQQTPKNVALAVALLDSKPAVRTRFLEWLKHLTSDTELLLLQEVVRPSAELLDAIAGYAPPPGVDVPPDRVAVVDLSDAHWPVSNPSGSLVASLRRAADPTEWTTLVIPVTVGLAGQLRQIAATLKLLSPEATAPAMGETVKLFCGGKLLARAEVTLSTHAGREAVRVDHEFLSTGELAA